MNVYFDAKMEMHKRNASERYVLLYLLRRSGVWFVKNMLDRGVRRVGVRRLTS